MRQMTVHLIMAQLLVPVVLVFIGASATSTSPPPPSEGANARPGKIMFYAPMISRSMGMTFMPLAEELARRGHAVTVVTPFEKEKGSRVQEHVAVKSTFQDLLDSFSRTALQPGGSTAFPFPQVLDKAIEAGDNALAHPQIRRYLDDPSTKFDVVVTLSWPPNESGLYLAHRFNASLVLLCTVQGSVPFQDYAFGQPHNPAYMPFVFLDVKHPMTFLQRVKNFVATSYFHFVVRRQEALLDKHFPNETRPTIAEMEKTASVGLHFGHPLLMDGLRPVAPNFEYIGMMNCRPASKLDGEVGRFLEESGEEGVVYVAFGAALRSSEMGEEKRQMFIRVFKSLKQRVLWKWETGEMSDAPPNVMVSKWLPQQDVLGHPKVKLYVSHGGQSSFQETLCHQKPTLVISVNNDQHANGREAERLGFGRSLYFHDADEESLRAAIGDLLGDPSYRERAREVGSLISDQFGRPLDRAAWWVEYLVRHPGAAARLRSPVHDLGWMQYFLVDVVAFLLAVASLVVYVICKLLCHFCCRRRSKKDKTN